jgi:hypothetical protein
VGPENKARLTPRLDHFCLTSRDQSFWPIALVLLPLVHHIQPADLLFICGQAFVTNSTATWNSVLTPGFPQVQLTVTLWSLAAAGLVFHAELSSLLLFLSHWSHFLSGLVSQPYRQQKALMALCGHRQAPSSHFSPLNSWGHYLNGWFMDDLPLWMTSLVQLQVHLLNVFADYNKIHIYYKNTKNANICHRKKWRFYCHPYGTTCVNILDIWLWVSGQVCV